MPIATPMSAWRRGRGVVDAVAGHRYHRTPVLPGADQPELLLRAGPGVHADAGHPLGQGLLVHAAQLGPGEDLAGPVEDADAAGDGGGRAGVVSGDHHRGDPSLPAGGHGGGRLGPWRVGDGHQPEQVQAALGGLCRAGHRR
jgi:hypothetical protein